MSGHEFPWGLQRKKTGKAGQAMAFESTAFPHEFLKLQSEEKK